VPDETPAAPSGSLSAQLGRFVRAVRDGDEQMVADVVMQVSRSRKLFAPLAFAVGGFAMLFNGLKLLFSNWRLTLVQILPAMWIWLAMLDLKAHTLHGKSFHVVRGWILVPLVLMIVAITAASFFLNAVFAFAIIQPGRPEVRPAVSVARTHLRTILAWGAATGLALAFATLIVTRWERPWFALSLGIVCGVMMIAYVAVPARLIGVKQTRSTRDKLTATAVGGAMGAVVCAPPYILGRIGLLMLGSSALLIPGIIVFAAGLTLQAGATGAVKAVKMSAKLVDPAAAVPKASSGEA
jgi:hypothetical protein